MRTFKNAIAFGLFNLSARLPAIAENRERLQHLHFYLRSHLIEKRPDKTDRQGLEPLEIMKLSRNKQARISSKRANPSDRDSED
ncbi:MAG: hypothetical protein AB4290_16025 [Spirulina sp.]